MPSIANERDLDFIEEVFQPQRSMGDCLPACIKGIYDEHREREELDNRLGYGQIRKGIGCHPKFGTDLKAEEIKGALNPEIEPEGHNFETSRGPELSLDNLRELLDDPRVSFPVVAVSDEWWEDPANPEAKKGLSQQWQHCVAVLGFEGERICVHDPLVRDLNSSDPEVYVFNVPRVRFDELWRGTATPCWTLWIEPMAEGYQATLEREWA